MSDILTSLELDFLGDLYEDDHRIWEIFDFVRLHHESLSDEEVLRLGQKVLLDWLQKNWVEIIDTENRRDKMGSEQTSRFFEKAGISLMTQFDSPVWIEITKEGENKYISSKTAGSNF